MTVSIHNAIKTEFDAAVMLFCFIALADGRFKPQELTAIKQQVNLLKLTGFDDLKDCEVSNWDAFIENLHLAANNFSFEYTVEQIPYIAEKITSKNLKSAILSAAFKISYSDGEFHKNEKRVTQTLSEIWNM
jgi:tellurite resistance protein